MKNIYESPKLFVMYATDEDILTLSCRTVELVGRKVDCSDWQTTVNG